jgi:4-nitrophenyl phosphatase
MMAIKGILFDLDGTVYLGAHEVPGASTFINSLTPRGIRSLFVTNRANRSPGEICEHLRSYGIDCVADDILTTAHATALHLKAGRYYHIGETALQDALDAQGLVYDEEHPDYVIVSFDRQFTYDKLKRAVALIGEGATFISTNPDRALKIEGGLLPGTGAIVAAVEAGSGQAPKTIGKPERLIFDIAVERMGLSRDEVIAVGDNLLTDIPAGAAAGIRTVLLLSGVSTREDIADSPCEPTWVAETFEELAAIVRRHVG